MDFRPIEMLSIRNKNAKGESLTVYSLNLLRSPYWLQITGTSTRSLAKYPEECDASVLRGMLTVHGGTKH